MPIFNIGSFGAGLSAYTRADERGKQQKMRELELMVQAAEAEAGIQQRWRAQELQENMFQQVTKPESESRIEYQGLLSQKERTLQEENQALKEELARLRPGGMPTLGAEKAIAAGEAEIGEAQQRTEVIGERKRQDVIPTEVRAGKKEAAGKIAEQEQEGRIRRQGEATRRAELEFQEAKSDQDRINIRRREEAGFYGRQIEIETALLDNAQRQQLAQIELMEAQALKAGNTQLAEDWKRLRQMQQDQWYRDQGYDPLGVEALSQLTSAGALPDAATIQRLKTTINQAISKLNTGMEMDAWMAMMIDLNPRLAEIMQSMNADADPEQAKEVLQGMLRELSNEESKILKLIVAEPTKPLGPPSPYSAPPENQLLPRSSQKPTPEQRDMLIKRARQFEQGTR